MPPRHAYWTIIIDKQATAFRAHDAEELLPTYNRLKEKNANVEMKWFERGKLFDSREAARQEGFGHGERRWEGPRPANRERREGREGTEGERQRDKSWRPGGDHRDPRQKYKDARKAKWQRFKQKLRSGRFEADFPPDRDARPRSKPGPRGERKGGGFASPQARSDKFGPPAARHGKREGRRNELTRDRSFTPPHGDKLGRARSSWRAENDWRGEKPARVRNPKRFGARPAPKPWGKPGGSRAPQGVKGTKGGRKRRRDEEE